MYQLVSALGKTLNFDGKYHPVEIGNSSMSSLYQDYTSIYVTLTNTSTADTEYVLDINSLPTQWRVSSISFLAFLIQNEDRVLPVLDHELDLTYRLVRFYDLWQWDFSARGHNRHYHPDYELDLEERIDVLITHPTANYVNMAKYCLFTVNGYLHRGDHSPYGLHILDGGISHRWSKNNMLGLIDFQHIGPIETIPITTDMLVQRVDGLSYSDAVYIRSPKPFTGVVPMLVIGGYLHPMGNLVQIVGDDTLKVNFRNLNWLDRYLESKDYLDLSSLNITPLTNGAMDAEQFYSDATIAAYLTLSQSFIVLVETPYLDVGVVPVSESGLAGRYYTGVMPGAPLVIGNGRIAEYKVTTENGIYVLAVDNYLIATRIGNTFESADYPALVTDPISINPTQHATAKFLMLSRTDT